MKYHLPTIPVRIEVDLFYHRVALRLQAQATMPPRATHTTVLIDISVLKAEED